MKLPVNIRRKSLILLSMPITNIKHYSQLDERQLEKMDKVLEEEGELEDCVDEIKDQLEPLQEPKPLDSISNVAPISTFSRKLSSSTAVTVINKLEKQLNEEKYEREKMRNEIEELRKMNEKLCEAIIKSQSSGSVINGGNSSSNI